VKAFPEEAESRSQELYHLWFAHLSDNINSVREHSAEAIVTAMEANEKYETEIFDLVKKEFDQSLMKVKEQKEDS